MKCFDYIIKIPLALEKGRTNSVQKSINSIKMEQGGDSNNYKERLASISLSLFTKFHSENK